MNYDVKLNPDGTGDAAGYDAVEGGERDDRRARRRLWLFGAGVFVLLVALWFAMNRTGGDALGADGVNQAPAVTVIAPGRVTITGQINATGAIAARREMPIGSVGDGGEVVRVLVEQGQWVRAGQPLAVIDSSVQTQQAAGMGAQIKVAQADARIAQSNLDRSLKLVQRGFISKADIDRLTATRDAAAASVKVAQAQYGESLAKNRRLTIVAPAAGLVLQRNVEPGQVVSGGGGVLFTIAKDGQMEMLAKLSEDDLAQLAVGVPAQVTPVGATRAFAGRIWQLTPTIDPATRLGQARIALAYAPGLRPGGFATATITAGTTVAPRLPESAVLNDAAGSYVFVVGADDKVARRAVRTGAMTDQGIAIAGGLAGDERVVLRAGAFLAEGEQVKPRLVAR